LAKANGNDKYSVFLIIFIHCRPIYGTDGEIQDKALAKNLIFRTLEVLSPTKGRAGKSALKYRYV
jgi:hypothetical protein